MNLEEKEQYLKEMLEEMNRPVKLHFMGIDEFVAQHNHVNYCEAIISPTGMIAYAEPSHCRALAATMGHMTEDEMYINMPDDVSPIDYLVNKTKYVSVWYSMAIYPEEGFNRVQSVVLDKLYDNGIISYNSDLLRMSNILDDANKGIEYF